MGLREEDYQRCEAAFATLEGLWTADAHDLAGLKALHRAFLDRYEQGRPAEGQKLLKPIDEMIDDLRAKWKRL